MFKIESLILTSDKGDNYTYQFSSGLNYFEGGNDCGKTEFYNFLDFMFGSSYDLSIREWYIHLENASIILNKDGIRYRLTRTKDLEVNYFSYMDEDSVEAIGMADYKDKINAIFSPDEKSLRELRSFMEEDITYRTFTLFNFLGEKRQGELNNFFDKLDDIKYSLKIDALLNFFFNENLMRIKEISKELESLEKEVKRIETIDSKNSLIESKVNIILSELGIKKVYKNNNASEILEEIETFENMEEQPTVDNKDLSSLSIYFNTLSEQIKEYDKVLQDSKKIENDNDNRRKLLKRLLNLAEINEQYNYLLSPIVDTLGELDNSISFSKYVRQDEVIKKLKKQKMDVKNELIRQTNKFKLYSLDEKTEKIVVVKDLLTFNIDIEDLKKLDKTKNRIRELKAELRVLKNSEDTSKIDYVSELMTEFYLSIKEVSSISKVDSNIFGFNLQYYKKGNSIQAVIEDKSNKKKESIYIGSLARHTMMQLCGYLSFLVFMIEQNRYPLIPFLVVDHISKNFDSVNAKAIGHIFDEFYNKIDIDDFQVFLFDDKESSLLNIVADHNEKLITDTKTGFIPFYVKK